MEAVQEILGSVETKVEYITDAKRNAGRKKKGREIIFVTLSDEGQK